MKRTTKYETSSDLPETLSVCGAHRGDNFCLLAQPSIMCRLVRTTRDNVMKNRD